MPLFNLMTLIGALTLAATVIGGFAVIARALWRAGELGEDAEQH